MVASEVKNAIILAANRILAANGLSGTTIEAVAAEAGVSKGGLLYYFPSKKDLMLALLEAWAEGFTARRQELLDSMPHHPNRLLKATVTAMLLDMKDKQGVPNLATILDDPVMRGWLGDFKRRMFEEVCHASIDQEIALLAMYVVDGVWMDMRFDPAIVDKERRRAAARKLLELIDAMAEDAA